MFDKLTDFVLFLQMLGTPVYESAYHKVIVSSTIMALALVFIVIIPSLVFFGFSLVQHIKLAKEGEEERQERGYGGSRYEGTWIAGVVAGATGVLIGLAGVATAITEILTADYQAYKVLIDLFQ